MRTHATGSTTSCHSSCRHEMPYDESQVDAWVYAARVFATRTVELRRMHPGSGEVGKLLMTLIRSINLTLRD